MELIIYILRWWMYFIVTVFVLFLTPILFANLYDLLKHKKKYTKKLLISFYVLVLCTTVVATTNIITSENVWASNAVLISNPWALAALLEAYFAFLTFYIWVFYKENSVIAKILWFLFIITLGNIAIAVYMLIQISRWQENEGIEKLVSRI
ncbi:DUF1475 family protein [Candidatus Uabimicrobium amorphum]|uniref:Uncharacterized protein n=1 Tax=Uabimicrobium amorphum TaxID=2596890 RepID=A0A5S9ITY3_UABAM|nr:hypothetical protein UABAM_06489 [Candidatus Uabimicrobium amorphum]